MPEAEVRPPHAPALGRVFGAPQLDDGAPEPRGHVLPPLGVHAPKHVALVVKVVRDGAGCQPVGEEIQRLEQKALPYFDLAMR